MKELGFLHSSVRHSVRFNGQHFGTGFRHVPGGDDYRNRSVLSYHYYCLALSLIPIPGDQSIPIFDRVLCDDIEGPALFQSVEQELARVGGSSFLTEFGGCDGSPVCDEQLEWGLSAADQFLQSWAFWGNGYHSEQTMQRLSRVYARAIAGKPLSMQYIARERLFYLSYYIDPDIQQPTEIYIPAIQFPESSYLVTVNAVLQWTVDPENKNLILIQPSRQHVTSGAGAIIGVVEIRAKASITKWSELIWWKIAQATNDWLYLFSAFLLLVSQRYDDRKAYLKRSPFMVRYVLGFVSSPLNSSSWSRSIHRTSTWVMNTPRSVGHCHCHCCCLHHGMLPNMDSDRRLVWKL